MKNPTLHAVRRVIVSVCLTLAIAGVWMSCADWLAEINAGHWLRGTATLAAKLAGILAAFVAVMVVSGWLIVRSRPPNQR